MLRSFLRVPTARKVLTKAAPLPTVSLANHELLSLKQLSDLEKLQGHFDASMRDARDVYYEDQHRYRRYGVVFRENGLWRVVRRPTPFFQAARLNSYLGGVVREYPRLLDDCVLSPAFQDLCTQFTATFPHYDFGEVHVHMIRVVCEPQTNGTVVVPEGVHQDGFDAIAMACVRRHNIDGAKTSIHATRDTPPILEAVVQDGFVMCVDDKALWHYVSPMTRATDIADDVDAHRDIIILHSVHDASNAAA
ncbi:hypothetical protein CTAYLR_002717 [Chrysophaeum taylorii]|uniref:2OG-Fe dioxygenase family protein n=1 Tax=Chrysophaeum taylorii TaxID=2483200 RepID=A0AAD7UE92_9STRA|nr:hypothetical protein CTAYLR_002717 [Chrysophaeum taylorii]